MFNTIKAVQNGNIIWVNQSPYFNQAYSAYGKYSLLDDLQWKFHLVCVAFYWNFALLFGIVASVCYGTKSIALLDIWQGIFASEKDSTTQLIIWESRLPRVLSTGLADSFLACSGSMMQGITRNPLASPSIMEVNPGSIFAAALFMAGGFGNVTWSSFQTLAWVLPVLMFSMAFSAKITILSLGDEVSVGLESLFSYI